jgi:hypothetical protein
MPRVLGSPSLTWRADALSLLRPPTDFFGSVTVCAGSGSHSVDEAHRSLPFPRDARFQGCGV